MKNSLLTILQVLLILFGLNSCEKKEESASCSTSYLSELDDQIQFTDEVYATYIKTPNTANCQHYKITLEVYIKKLEPYGNCPSLVGEKRKDWERLVASLESSRAALNC